MSNKRIHKAALIAKACLVLILFTPAIPCTAHPAVTADPAVSPYDRQVAAQLKQLSADTPDDRAAAAESLGYLRACRAADAIAAALQDESAAVRREAAMSLGWCGGRKHVPALLAMLDDPEWTVGQAAWAALTNITGMDFPFDALDAGKRVKQAERWRAWWASVPGDRPPPAVLALLSGARKPTGVLPARSAAVTSVYKGSAEILIDGAVAGDFWQTKNVGFPQSCTIDMGRTVAFRCVVVHQHRIEAMHMTDFALLVGDDGESFREVCRKKGPTPARLVIPLEPTRARYIRITSYATGNSTYPTTFHEVAVRKKSPPAGSSGRADPEGDTHYRIERGLRALGALGGEGAATEVREIIRPWAGRTTGRDAEKRLVQAGIRALGRLGGPGALELLTAFLDNPHWSVYAADAMGDLGDPAAADILIGAYPSYAKTLKRGNPKKSARYDRPGLSPIDRMYATPYAICHALCRIPLDRPGITEKLRTIAPLIVANVPGDYDGAMLYEPEACRLASAYLLHRAGLRQAVVDVALHAFGRPRPLPDVPEIDALKTAAGRMTKVGGHKNAAPFPATWLPVFCRDTDDVPDLVALLEHENGWVRINAAKALSFMEAGEAVEPLIKILADSRPEAAYGYFGKFLYDTKHQGQDEYNDPCPRWREAFVYALANLGAREAVDLMIGLLEDERNVLEIRYAAACALDRLGGTAAIEALTRAAAAHPYHSIRLVAREALWRRGIKLPAPHATPVTRTDRETGQPIAEAFTEVVFIKGPHLMPNAFQIDEWRQAYSTTDSGPTYRLGKNLHILHTDTKDVRQLTDFAAGWVADCEVSWDGKTIIFCRRGGDTDPWWHIYEISADGGAPRQLTGGPFHDVQPAYLPDGRIVFSSSRIGLRDEYHGYFATGLTVMNPDGSDIHCIGFNLGRDGEPSIMDDGRILFSRLELFYSRMKTEWNIEAVFPDGTRNVVLYGPERRGYWKNVTRRSGERGWGESGPRHRTLRLVQPQPFDAGRQICVTTGGLTIVGQGRFEETRVPHDQEMAVTSPFPLPDGTILCAAGERKFRGGKGRGVWAPTDLGLYLVDAATGAMEQIYNDPARADFEPRPIAARPRPPILSESPLVRAGGYIGRLQCNSVFLSQEARVGLRGTYIRVVEGIPVVGRHQTHTSGGLTWKNHVGTVARVLGTLPLARDGSFFVDVPADRLIHCQVLDADRRVVGNQLIWMYTRPGENKSCAGCHERPDSSPLNGIPAAARTVPGRCLPAGGEFRYRAKFWNKGSLPDEGEQRTRTVRAINLMGRL